MQALQANNPPKKPPNKRTFAGLLEGLFLVPLFLCPFAPFSFFAIYSNIYSFFLYRYFVFLIIKKAIFITFFCSIPFVPMQAIYSLHPFFRQVVSSNYTMDVRIFRIYMQVYCAYIIVCMYVVYFRAYIILRAHATLRRGALSSLATFATFAAVLIDFCRPDPYFGLLRLHTFTDGRAYLLPYLLP